MMVRRPLWFSATRRPFHQRPCDQLDDMVEPHQELSGGDVHDQNSPVEVLAHVRLDRRHDVRNTKALEISGCTGSKKVREV